MTRLLKSTLASIALAALFTGAAHAQVVAGLDGRWEGPLTTQSGATITAIFRVETKAGKTTAFFDLPEQGAKNIEAKLARDGDKVTFDVSVAQLQYVGTLSADGSKITGEMGQGPIKSPVVLAHNVSTYVVPTTPAVQGLDGNWQGIVSTPVGDIPVVFRVSTKDGKTTSLMDSPSQDVNDIPALTTRNGQAVAIDVPGVHGNFAGSLSADGKTLSGFWTQSGMDFAIELTKK
jgi:hypothetical protein